MPKAIITTEQFNLAPGLDLASRFGLLSVPQALCAQLAHMEMSHVLLKVT